MALEIPLSSLPRPLPAKKNAHHYMSAPFIFSKVKSALGWKWPTLPKVIPASVTQTTRSIATPPGWDGSPVPLPPGQDYLENSPPLAHKGWLCPGGCPEGGGMGMVTVGIEPCIRRYKPLYLIFRDWGRGIESTWASFFPHPSFPRTCVSRITSKDMG